MYGCLNAKPEKSFIAAKKERKGKQSVWLVCWCVQTVMLKYITVYTHKEETMTSHDLADTNRQKNSSYVIKGYYVGLRKTREKEGWR